MAGREDNRPPETASHALEERCCYGCCAVRLAIARHCVSTAAGSLSLFLMKPMIFHIASSDIARSHVGIVVVRTPCFVTQNNHARSSWGMRLISCGAGGLNLSCIGLIFACAPPWQSAQCCSYAVAPSSRLAGVIATGLSPSGLCLSA